VKEAYVQERNDTMMLEINEQEKEVLISQLEVMVLPELRCQIGSRVPKDIRDDLKKDKMMLVSIVEKLKASS
jgi:hypothetical protein